MGRWGVSIAALAAGTALAWPIAGGGQGVPAGASAPGPTWAVDPADPGPDRPPVGRSLFDFVATTEADGKRAYDVPFPYERLVERLEARAGCAPQRPCAQQVLIPLGRSLQRTVAAPDFFRYPRIVATLDREPGRSTGWLLRDRVYLGYQEKANLIEVISYNEAAGRFEFQLVRNYHSGGTPEIVYARRAVCAACHQNLAPIFSRALWQETNANPRVAALLARNRSDFHGVPVQRGVDTPDAIDAAIQRANLSGVWQRLWREGCGGDDVAGVRCRAAAFAAALQYRLTDERAFDDRAVEWREGFLPVFAREWRRHWAGGLAIPNPDLPNRDPLPAERARPAAGAALTHVAAQFEPLLPRPPLAVWTIDQPDTVRRFVAGIADFMAAADARALDEELAARAARARPSPLRYEAPCEVAWADRWLRFKCLSAEERSPQSARLAGRIDLDAGRAVGGELSALGVGYAASLHRFDLKAHALDLGAGRLSVVPASRGMGARLADGSVVESVELRWRPSNVSLRAGAREVRANAVVSAADDFAPVRDAIAALAADTTARGAFNAQPFSRARILGALFSQLGLAPREWCCVAAALLPSARDEADEPPLPTAGPAKDFAAFYPYCASCHATSERFPPNFLAGPGERVAASMRHCAPRIYARLAMWQVAPAARDKTPMPPAVPSASAAHYTAPAPIAGLERAMAELLVGESGTAPRIEQLLAGGYEALRPCLPAADQPAGGSSAQR